MLKIAHIVNPVTVDESSDLYAAQPVTFETMRFAQSYAADKVEVELYSAQFSNDVELVPPWFIKTQNFDRSVLDIGTFMRQRRLPLIKEILDRLYESSKADYFIYTNVDIALMPSFYNSIAQLIEAGHDAMVINRRTIAKEPNEPSQLPLMWAQVGKKHPGYDCFVFSRDAYPHYELGTACIGANWIGRVLLANVHAHANNFRIYEDCHLTFHLGDDRSWKTTENLDYDAHNLNELLKSLEVFKGSGRFAGKPMLEQVYRDMLREKSQQR